MLDWIIKYWVEIVFGVIAAAIAWGYRRMVRRVKAELAGQNAVKEGMQALLRDRLIQAHMHYIERGSITYHGLESVLSMYDAYHGLDGNGTVTTLVNELKELPIVQD